LYLSVVREVHALRYSPLARTYLPNSRLVICKMVQLFSVPAFFILFRETLEAAIILSVMMVLIDSIVADTAVRRRMKKHVWWGVVLGVLLSMVVAAVFISLYYTVAKEAWESSEPLWEGILSLIAVVLITVMGFSMIRVDTWRAKWERKLTKVTVETLNKQGEVQSKRSKYALFLLPLSIVLREGVEAVVFLGGVGLDGSGTAIPIPAVVGALCGVLAGYLLYKGGSHVGFKWFLSFSTVLLFLIAAGLFAGAVHEFEEYTESEAIIWELHCCHHDKDGIWKILNAIVGWRDEATVGTLVAYIVYWVFVLATFIVLKMKWLRDAEREAADLKLTQAGESNPKPPV
jgi:high-affinity iron transporter